MSEAKLCPFCGATGIEPTRWDLDILEDPATGGERYDVRMVMNCPTCGVSLIGPDGIAETVEAAEEIASERVIDLWNTRYISTEPKGQSYADCR